MLTGQKLVEDSLSKEVYMRIAIIGLIAGVILIGAGVFFKGVEEKEQVGQKIVDLGRDHVSLDTKVEYNSNPPTSGPHSEEWGKAGVYKEPLNDLKLVHSLEHGYVVISYNCENCGELINNLTNLAGEKKLWKLIVVPRPNLDSLIALTAWTRIDKFNEFDKARIEKFINAYRNKGPEKTME